MKTALKILTHFWFMKLLAGMCLKLTKKTFVPLEMKCWWQSATCFQGFSLWNIFKILQFKWILFTIIFCLQFLEFSCVNCRVSRRTFLGKSQIDQKKAKLAGASAQSNYFMRHQYFYYYEVFQSFKIVLILKIEFIFCQDENKGSWFISVNQ